MSPTQKIFLLRHKVMHKNPIVHGKHKSTLKNIPIWSETDILVLLNFAEENPGSSINLRAQLCVIIK